jgi:subfamily B ATP-binding cassette protein HlyB/CyaB
MDTAVLLSTAAPPPSPHHTALRCLFMMALHRGVTLHPEQFAGVAEGDTIGSVLRVLRDGGLNGVLSRRAGWEVLRGATMPAMAQWLDGHWVMLLHAGEEIRLLDPRAEDAGVIGMPREVFLRDWSGVAILCQKPTTETSEPFGLRWFLPDILRHAGLFRDVALAATMSSLIAFATPLMFQILIDKVIVHRGTQTLAALMAIFAVLTLFDGFFGYVRQILMTTITSKVDARLASRVFQHLLSLPLVFFESTTAGVLARNLQQTDTIRQFLTGRLFQTLLDAVTLPLMLVMLFLYSGKLTLIVLGFSLLMACIIGIMVPGFRRHLETLYQAEGARQGHLIETIHGMRTVKSLALEPLRQRDWNEKVTAGARRRATVGRIGALAGVLTHGLDKAMQISVLGFGAVQVFEGHLSIGALVAFNMVSGRVTGPLVQIVGLISEYQETSLALRMLGSVMRQPPEREPDRIGMTPPIRGALSFEMVSFRYHTQAVLDRVSFVVEPGQIVGIVGRSGSGKTTLTRLIQGILVPQEGMIRMDGVDLRHIDLGHLRRSTGVVLQENFLFRGTVRDNIAAARPEAGLAEIVGAAQLAGADEFIGRLPHGYETTIEESGANFSGGQRQRIAIARALLPNPRLLIFDEATSALDPESEAVVQENLAAIAAGRTLIIVSHRLTSLVVADAILVLEQGRVLDFAPHMTLLERCDIYRRLWDRQTRHFG